MDSIDDDALSVMKRAGQEFADKQYYRHYANDWKLPEEQQQERVAHWRAVKDRIGEIVGLIKREMKEAGK